MRTIIPTILKYKCVESTNITAKQLAREGAASGTVVLAEEQTQGRGRLGRHFFAPPQRGLYMSAILRPDFDADNVWHENSRSNFHLFGGGIIITAAAAVAVCKAIEQVCVGVQPQIKWVNDVYVEGKKVCGILVEGVLADSGAMEALVVGIGINSDMPTEDFPEELRETAGSLIGVSKERLAEATLRELFDTVRRENSRSNYQYLAGESISRTPDDALLAAYRVRSMVIGKDVQIHQNPNAALLGEGRLAKAIDISAEGGLIVRYENGEEETLISGEISLRLAPSLSG